MSGAPTLAAVFVLCGFWACGPHLDAAPAATLGQSVSSPQRSADTGASSQLKFLTAGVTDWLFTTPNFTSGEPSRLDLVGSNNAPAITIRQSGKC